ncbi:hypothetical protein VKT23_005941 [Stygiomarasmius scandens]|uniref:amidase n=1 Tax=Marasmiellus scandens TaxID=2682957 RepID=A0ABR1JQV8_9AGAR
MTWSNEAIKAKKATQFEAIPSEWRIPADKLPPESVTNVISFYKTCGILTQPEIDIVDLEPGVLLSRLANGSLTALETTIAFCKAAAIAHQLTNCLTEIFFDRAIERAKELDDLFTKNDNKPVGPLHGCPISLKDQFQIKGTECNMGIASWLGEISERDSVLVTILKDAGAVQVLLDLAEFPTLTFIVQFGESDNYVYGRTSNPYNRTLTCGGSSGGEGALVALHGSVLGVGTDLGGSVRIPACYQGLFGLRPSLHRLPYAGARNTLLGLEGIASALGPICRSLDGVAAFTKSVIDGEPWLLDPKSPEIPWREEMTLKKPVFGVMYWDEVVMPHPPVRRALSMTINALKDAGYEVVEFTPFNVAEAESIAKELYASDGGEDLSRTFSKSGEPWYPLIVTGGMDKKISVWESWQLNVKKDNFREAYLNHWNNTKSSTGKAIDGLLLPPSPSTAHVINQWHRYLTYTAFFNLVDLPAMVIPVGASVDPVLDPVDVGYKPVSELDAAIQNSYSPELFENAPLSVQLVGRRLREEEVISMAWHVVGALKASSA